MGFDNRTTPSKPTIFMKIKNESDASKTITGKFFSISKKEDGKWIDELQKSNGYPTPFYGMLKDIKLDLDKKIKRKDGIEVPLPTVKFYFQDETNQYVLDLPFTNDKGRVNNDVFNMLNSMASIEKFGMIKLFIHEVEKEGGRKDFSLIVRNDKDWNENSDTSVFSAPKDKTLADKTKVSWKYKYDDVPKHMIKIINDGTEFEAKNDKKHQQFFIDIVNNEILPKLKGEYSSNSVDTIDDDNEPVSDDLPF